MNMKIRCVISISVIVAVYVGNVLALPITIGRNFIIVQIGSHAYCMRGGSDEYVKWAERVTPEFPEGDRVKFVGQLEWTEIPGHRGEYKLGWSVNEDGQVVGAAKIDDEKSRWIVTEVRSFTAGGDDVIRIYKISNVAADASRDGKDDKHAKKYIGIGTKPLVLKDKKGKEHKFYPLELVEADKAAEFWVNDYSGK